MAFSFRHLSIVRDAAISPPDISRKLPLYDPAGLLDRLNRAFRRRVSDRVEDVFKEACVAGDPDTAAALLSILERMHARGAAQHGAELRINDDAIVKAREALLRCEVTRGMRVSPKPSQRH